MFYSRAADFLVVRVYLCTAVQQSENISTESFFHRYVFKEDDQQEYIRTLSEKLESMFANFINLLENDLLSAALEKINDCIMTAAEGMKKSTLKHFSKIGTHCQPWFDAECVSFRCKTLKALRCFTITSSLESLSIYQCIRV